MGVGSPTPVYVMAKRFGTFGTRKRHPILQRLIAYLQQLVQAPERFNPAVMQGFKQQLIVFFNQNVDSSMAERNTTNFGTGEVPRLLTALAQRYKNIWKQQMDRAFATAIDGLTGRGVGRNASRLTLVTNIARELLGLGEITVSEKRALGIVRLTRNLKRVFRQPLDSYLTMLLNTVPRNLIRDYERLLGTLIIDDDVLFKVSPNPIPESADTCRFVSNKVLTPEALKLASNRRVVSAPLFHPNCFLPGTPVPTTEGVMPICEVGRGTSVDLGGGVSQPVVGTLVREYVGEVVTIGYGVIEVTSTPDHLYLTQRGWLRAEGLRVGAKLVNYSLAEFPIGIDGSVFESEDEVALATEECIANAVFPLLRPVSVSTPVHFDVESVEAKVQHVAPNGNLHIEPRERLSEQGLVRIELCLETFAIRLRTLLLDRFQVSVATVLYEVLLRRAALYAEPIHEAFDTGRTLEAHERSDLIDRKTFFVIDPLQKGFDFARVLVRKRTSVDTYAHSYYSGEVFDLTVPGSGCYIAGSTFVHNCRHSIQSILEKNYKGPVVTEADVRREIRAGRIRRRKS